MWRWTRQIAALLLAVRFGSLVWIALIADFPTMIAILIPAVMFVVIVVHLTRWRRRDESGIARQGSPR